MNELSDGDWLRVNAYHDGELQEDVEAFERRLESEPALAAALASLRATSASLRRLRPQKAAACAPASRQRGFLPWLAGAIAASLVTGVVIGAIGWARIGAGQNTPMAIHRDFAAQSYFAGDDVFQSVDSVRVGGFPDLGAANLKLVATRSTGSKAAAHYAGSQGCRLTVIRSQDAVGASAQAGLQNAEWRVDDAYYMALASGMDARRFAAIADFLQHQTRGNAKDVQVMALRDTTADATPCG